MKSVDSIAFPGAVSDEPGVFAATGYEISGPGFVLRVLSRDDGGGVSVPFVSSGVASGGREGSFGH